MTAMLMSCARPPGTPANAIHASSSPFLTLPAGLDAHACQPSGAKDRKGAACSEGDAQLGHEVSVTASAPPIM